MQGPEVAFQHYTVKSIRWANKFFKMAFTKVYRGCVCQCCGKYSFRCYKQDLVKILLMWVIGNGSLPPFPCDSSPFPFHIPTYLPTYLSLSLSLSLPLFQYRSLYVSHAHELKILWSSPWVLRSQGCSPMLQPKSCFECNFQDITNI